MDKNLKKAFISYIVIMAAVFSFLTTMRFFSGAAVTYGTLFIALGVMVYLVCCDSFVRSRTRDLLIISIVFAVLQFVNLVAFEFPFTRTGSVEGFWNYQVVLACLALVFLAYGVFRAIYEAKGLKVGFIEAILGNHSGAKKVKQSKEFANGSLEAKPSRKRVNQVKQEPEEVEEDYTTDDEEE